MCPEDPWINFGNGCFEVNFILFNTYTAIKTNQLMTYKAKATVCSEIRAKHSAQSEHHIEILNVTPSGT